MKVNKIVFSPEDLEIYHLDTLVKICQERFSARFFSISNKSIPGAGSPCYEILNNNLAKNIEVEKVTHHKCGDITFFTKWGNIKVWASIK